ncbi:cysteine-rich KTR domain-containing protein, partial [Escherichia coli]
MCPVCGNKTRLKIREDTELKKFPLYCPKCRQENLIEIKQFIDRNLNPQKTKK